MDTVRTGLRIVVALTVLSSCPAAAVWAGTQFDETKRVSFPARTRIRFSSGMRLIDGGSRVTGV